MWRWSSYKCFRYPVPLVFSTYVEVILSLKLTISILLSFLHICGGDPNGAELKKEKLMFSPHMWRWSSRYRHCNTNYFVFSTYVEVILQCLQDNLSEWRFLHICGGDPKVNAPAKLAIAFSPHMWRWSCLGTCEGNLPRCFLHICGGDPI